MLVVAMPFLKNEAPPELVESVGRIESCADACHTSLPLLKIPSNIAVWGLLTGSIGIVEEAAAEYSQHSKDFSAALVNISRFTPIALKWAINYGKAASRVAHRRWTTALREAVDHTLSVANQYGAFCSCLPMWHKNRYAAEAVSERLIRFVMPGSARDRQVSAHLKGFRPGVGNWKVKSATPTEQTPRAQRLFASVLERSRKTGARRFEYDDPWTLWQELLPCFHARVTGIARRPDSLSLGPYTLGQFKRFYAALLTVCAAHEFLCFTWERRFGSYPLDSAVMVRSTSGWIDSLSTLSDIPADKCQAAMSDLTFNFARSLDLHIHPFVPLDLSTRRIAIAPQFPLHSLPDENILRVCSQIRPSPFNVTSSEKEPEMLSALSKQNSPFHLEGPVSLPNPVPDIDLIVTDEESSTLVFAEMKWVRKTSRPTEFQDRDADVRKGVSQLTQIREFVACNREHLQSLGKLRRRVNEYRNVYYLFACRSGPLAMDRANRGPGNR